MVEESKGTQNIENKTILIVKKMNIVANQMSSIAESSQSLKEQISQFKIKEV